MAMAEAGAEGGSAGGSGSSAEGATATVEGQGSGTPPADSGQTLLGDRTSLLDWRAGLPDNYRTAPLVQNHQTLEAMVKTALAQEEMIGRGLYLPREEPGTEAHAAAMAKIYAKLGRPNTAADYALAVPEGRDLDPEDASYFRNIFHAEGFNQKQVDAVMNGYWGMVKRAENMYQGQDQRSRIEGMRALDAEFGVNAPAILAKAKGFFQHFGAGAFGGEGGERAAADLEDAVLSDGSRLLNRPHVIAALAEAMDRLGEGQWIDTTDYRPGTNTLEALTARHRELTQKKLEGKATQDELTEVARLAQQLASARDRAQQGRRVA